MLTFQKIRKGRGRVEGNFKGRGDLNKDSYQVPFIARSLLKPRPM